MRVWVIFLKFIGRWKVKKWRFWSLNRQMDRKRAKLKEGIKIGGKVVKSRATSASYQMRSSLRESFHFSAKSSITKSNDEERPESDWLKWWGDRSHDQDNKDNLAKTCDLEVSGAKSRGDRSPSSAIKSSQLFYLSILVKVLNSLLFPSEILSLPKHHYNSAPKIFIIFSTFSLHLIQLPLYPSPFLAYK